MPSWPAPLILPLNSYVNILNKMLNLNHFPQCYGFYAASLDRAITQNKCIIYQRHDSCMSSRASEGKWISLRTWIDWKLHSPPEPRARRWTSKLSKSKSTNCKVATGKHKHSPSACHLKSKEADIFAQVRSVNITTIACPPGNENLICLFKERVDS